jgi:hypothetical protein
VNVFLHYAATTIELVPFKNDDSMVRKYTETFVAMYKRLERYLQSQSQTKESANDTNQTENFILSFFWNVSDSTIVVPWLLDIGLTKMMLEFLKIGALAPGIIVKISAIIHNISRHDDGADELNKFSGLLILKDFQNSGAEMLNGLAGKRRKGKHRTGKCRKNHQIGEYRKGKCRKAGRRNIKWCERKISKGNCRKGKCRI